MASAQQEDRHFEIDHLATSVLFVAPTCCEGGSAGYAALRSGAVEAPPVLRRQALGVKSKLNKGRKRCCPAALQKVHVKIMWFLIFL